MSQKGDFDIPARCDKEVLRGIINVFEGYHLWVRNKPALNFPIWPLPLNSLLTVY